VNVDLTAERLRLHLHPCAAPAITVGIDGSTTAMAGGETREFPLER
jgi:hypothetical protein